MRNLIRADIYRLRRDSAFKFVFFGLLITTLVMALLLKTLSLDSVSEAFSKSVAFTQSDVADLQDMQAMIPQNATDFVQIMMSSNLLCFFFLAFIVSIFCADYSHGTFRNLLSFESGRTRVYLTKLGLGICCCILLNLVLFLISLVVGSLFFGIGEISLSYFTRQITCLMLMLPLQLSVICFGHCISAFRQKVSATIAIYLIGLTVLTTILQLLAILPILDWLRLLDWNSVGKLIYTYETMSANEILIMVGFGLLTAALTTVLGVAKFKRADLA